jgi:hypothetical protein
MPFVKISVVDPGRIFRVLPAGEEGLTAQGLPFLSGITRFPAVNRVHSQDGGHRTELMEERFSIADIRLPSGSLRS